MAPDDATRREVDRFLRGLERRNPHETEFHQAVREVAVSVMPFLLEHPEYREAQILERMTEPDRIVTFRVTWEGDDGRIRANRAWRVQFNNSIGPYKGGLRFHRDLTLSVLKFLGFEQTFKNALTGLPMGGAKGGANFDPKGRSEREVMRFCQSMMVELHRHIGEDVDVPAGDIGVGAREIGYLFGQYKRIENRFHGILTGKGVTFGGSLVRTEATGWGAVYMAREAMARRDAGLDGARCLVSGAGNVATHTAGKLIELGATVLTLSDTSGTLYARDGLDAEELAAVVHHKTVGRGVLADHRLRSGVVFLPGARPWEIACDAAFPCATQNELGHDDAVALADGGCRFVVEGANMPCTSEAVATFDDRGVVFVPGKAANAGGVAVSGLEQTQNATRIAWTADEVDGRLLATMRSIHDQCVEHGTRPDGTVDYVVGANVAGFRKVAAAMLAHGAV